MRTSEIICFDLGRCVSVEHALARPNEWQSRRKEAFASFTTCSVTALCTTYNFTHIRRQRTRPYGHTQRCQSRKSLFCLCHFAVSWKNTPYTNTIYLSNAFRKQSIKPKLFWNRAYRWYTPEAIWSHLRAAFQRPQNFAANESLV